MKDMLIYALSFYGTKEIAGSKHNKIILDMFAESGFANIKNDETAWCSAFIIHCAKYCGYEYTGSLLARSWLDAGKVVKDCVAGDIVIMWRDDPFSKKGHVGIFINRVDDDIYVLGGNQNNCVNITAYPVTRVLGYRRLNKRN